MRTPLTCRPRARRTGALALAVAATLASGPAPAQTDEIQVYDGELAAPGIFTLTWHNNYTPDGQASASFPGGMPSGHAWNGVTEWAYGVTPWFEAGLYLPLYSYAADGSLRLDGCKLRALFAVPDAATRRFFYGVNFEFSYNNQHWDEYRYSSEIRPIVGWRHGRIELVFNPILDNSYRGVGQLELAPATRLAYRVDNSWTIAAEEYDDFGTLRRLLPSAQQTHQLFAVVDYQGRTWAIEGGVGFGYTQTSDRLTLKLILSRDLNGRERR